MHRQVQMSSRKGLGLRGLQEAGEAVGVGERYGPERLQGPDHAETLCHSKAIRFPKCTLKNNNGFLAGQSHEL